MPEFWHHIDPTLHPIDFVVLPFTFPSDVIQQENDGIEMGNITQSNGWRQTRDPCIEFKTQPEMTERIEFKPHHRTEMA